jgi:integrase
MEPTNKRKLSEGFVRTLRPRAAKFIVWDEYQRGLGLLVQPSGHKSWKCVYSRHGRPRWYHLGVVGAIGLADARKLANRVMFEVSEGKDPAGDKRAARANGTFEELAKRYVNEYSKKKNKSWKRMDAQIQRHAIPRIGKLLVSDISRADIKAMVRSIGAPISANMTLAYTSAIFAWAIREDILKVNPCHLVDRHETNSRDRVLSDSEIPAFWNSFDGIAGAALKLVLLLGQRPGEIAHMRSEHIKDGWWELPGKPDPKLGWPGTKNGANHRVWLPQAAQSILADLRSGPIFGGNGTRFSDVMREQMRVISEKLGGEPARPHDLRRTHGSRITGLGFGRDAMNRVQNHIEGGIADVYDQHKYAEENKRIMEAVASSILALIEGRPADNVIALNR